MFRPRYISPNKIYQFEERYYPKSSWDYCGSSKNWHYFKKYGESKDGVVDFSLFYVCKLKRSVLPYIKGYPYDKENIRSTSTDMEIHQDHIRLHIDGENPAIIPFKSKGFLTADRRPKRDRKEVKVRPKVANTSAPTSPEKPSSPAVQIIEVRKLVAPPLPE